MSIEAIVIQAGEGKVLQMLGTEVAYKAEGERPGNGPTFLEFSVASGFYTGTTSTAGSKRSSTWLRVSSGSALAIESFMRSRATSSSCRQASHTASEPPISVREKSWSWCRRRGSMTTTLRSWPRCWPGPARLTSRRSPSYVSDTIPSRCHRSTSDRGPYKLRQSAASFKNAADIWTPQPWRGFSSW
jgi:hypothetical protein